MFSRLDSLFSTQIRQAEALDTRQAIRRHEEQGERRRERGDHEDNDSDLWQDDRATVSVRALTAFLEQLIAAAGAAPADNASAGMGLPPVHTPEKPESKPVSEHAARAAQAYQKTLSAARDAIPAAPAASMPVINLQPEEVRIIHGLIADLRILADRNIEVLTLAKSDSFLQSLVLAVQAAKS